MKKISEIEALQEAMNESGIRQVDLAEHFGVNRSTISTSLRRNRMSVGVFAKMLSAMGYDVAVGKEKDGTFVPEWYVE